MLAVALLASSLIGVALGVLGGGGSLLLLPLLTYLLHMDPKAAIASTLFVVTVTSAVGVGARVRGGQVRWAIGVRLGLAGMAGAFLGGRLSAYLPHQLLLLLFAAMMVVTAAAMLRERPAAAPRRALTATTVLTQGAAIGLVAGVVGAGGGFLVVPALTLLGGLDARAAVATSMLVIAMQSLAGLVGHLGHVALDWALVAPITAAAVIGSMLGSRLAGRLSPQAVRRGFGWLVLAMAALVLSKELL
jgi:uncharacterized protein